MEWREPDALTPLSQGENYRRDYHSHCDPLLYHSGAPLYQ
jgi:hypothetical protein